jgi:NADH-quinone oxidoreductase subunit J
VSSRPEFAEDISFLPGLAAVALFGVMAAVFVNVQFESATAGFPADASITASLGYVLLDLNGTTLAEATPGFLAAFIIVAVLLDAALDASVYLADREEGGDTARADGGDR